MSKRLILSLGLALSLGWAGFMPTARVQAVDLEQKFGGTSPRAPESDGSTTATDEDAAADAGSEAVAPDATEPSTDDPAVAGESKARPEVEAPQAPLPADAESDAEEEAIELPELDDSGTDTDDVTTADAPASQPTKKATENGTSADDELTIPTPPAPAVTATDTGEEPAIDGKQAAVDSSPAIQAGPGTVRNDGAAPAVAAGSATAKSAAPATPAPVPTAQKPQAASPPKKPVLLPGTGSLVKGIGDDFEDEKWQWNYNHPKSSEEQDKRIRGPLGRSVNGRWFEGPKRGTPDVVKRIPLPAPGLDGSGHGLLMATLHAGIPGRVTYDLQQDDLIYNMQKVTGRGIAVVDNPSVVVRVYMPPYVQWEKRSGPTFGFRAGCYTHAIITGKDHPDKGRFGLEEYWPGMFVCYEPANAKRKVEEHAYLRIRGGRNGGEIRGPKITETGWWTLGLSFTPDGMVHYFASPGVDELTMDDHITSQFPYGYRTEHLKTFFFNVCTRDDGKTWSTPWVIDDPKVYFLKRQMAATPPPSKR